MEFPGSPRELRGKSLSELQALADDLRQAILSVSMKNGGHLGASLGAVELAIAAHVAFESPDEAIVWDVGHQAYAHKLLTGRGDRFDTLRKTGGISGFLSRAESPYDAFGAGHSSTAISAALGIAWAKARDPKTAGQWTVAIVGDGGLTAGLALEALNNAGSGEKLGPLLIVLNDNQMSISANVGGLSRILSQGKSAEFFELLGFDYQGPIDGHDLEALLNTFHSARANYSGRPIIVHALTQKGRGYAPAESAPASYHGVSPLASAKAEPAIGTPTKSTAGGKNTEGNAEESAAGKSSQSASSYSDAFGRAVVALAEKDPRVVAITAAMPDGTGLTAFARKFPDRFFDVGIAEAHAVTFAAGLATQGVRPVVAIYSTFLQRACDSVIHDVAIQNLDVIFAIDRAGIVGADGPTHHGAFDLSLFGAIPNLRIIAPACLGDVEAALTLALESGGPWLIRYPRGGGPDTLNTDAGESKTATNKAADGSATATVHRTSELAKPLSLRWLTGESANPLEETPAAAIIALGATAPRAAKAAQLAMSATGQSIAAAATAFAKPISPALIAWLKARPELPLVIVEDGAIRGGFGQALAASLGPRSGAIDFAGYEDHFIAHGSPAALEDVERLSAEKLAARVQAAIARAGAATHSATSPGKSGKSK